MKILKIKICSKYSLNILENCEYNYEYIRIFYGISYKSLTVHFWKFLYFLNFQFVSSNWIKGDSVTILFYCGGICVWVNGVASREKPSLMLRIRGNFSGTINAK